MKAPDFDITPPVFENDSSATAQTAAAFAKLQEILQFIMDNLGVKVVDVAPAAGEIKTVGDGKGNVISEIVILNDDVQSSRKIYYKDKAGNLRLIDSA